MKKIKLTQGKVAIVSDVDYMFLTQWGWYFYKGYAVRTSRKGEFTTRRQVPMHQVVMGRKLFKNSLVYCDHKDRDGLDNLRSNLRLATPSQQNSNRGSSVGTSRFRGVSWKSSNNKWVSQIQIEGVVKHIGYFIDEQEAADAYDKMAISLFGEFACINE